jgi:hypothetical protein
VTGEALHLAHLIAAHGYLFPIDDHILTAKNDNTYYRFQVPYPTLTLDHVTINMHVIIVLLLKL